MNDVVIVSAARTPVGSFGGSLSSVIASDLGAAAIKASLERGKIGPSEVDEVILGQILTAGQGQNPARQAAINSGIPQDKTAYQINQLCGSGLRAVALAYQAIKVGDARIVIAGGQENMSLAPHTANLRNGQKMGDMKFSDSMIKDALWCAFNDYHMGNTAENIAEQWSLTREQQDEFACASQNKAEAAITSGKFKEQIAAVTYSTRKGDITVIEDDYPKFGTTMESLAKLRPAFSKTGTVTAGNASGINDGAAAITVMSAQEAKARKIEPLGRIVSWATAGVDPRIMGTGPIPASRQALEKAGWSVADLDIIEANEAFAAQAISVNIEMEWDPAIVNVNGGAIALGHPVGASGARVLTTLLYAMKDRNAKKALATLCIGGGMGVAMCIERD